MQWCFVWILGPLYTYIKELNNQIHTEGSEIAPKCLILLLVCSQKTTFWISLCSS